MAGDPDLADDSVTESRHHNRDEHGDSLDRDSQQREPESGGENENADTQLPETPLDINSSESPDADVNLEPAETNGNAVPRIVTPQQAHRADIRNALTETIHSEEDSLQSRTREQAASQSDNDSRVTIPGTPPTPRYFRPEFPYEKRWKVHRAGIGLKRPKIKSIGRINPEILLRRNQNTENDLISQAVTVPAILHMETMTQSSPPRLVSHHQHIAGVSEQTIPYNPSSTLGQGLQTPANEPVSMGSGSISSLLPNNVNNNDLQSKGTDVQLEQKFETPPAAESPDKKIQLPSAHQTQTCRWISATAGDFADKDREDDHLYQLLSEVPCSSKQADERDQIYLRQIGEDKSKTDADDRATSKNQSEISNTAEHTTQWEAESSGRLDDDASPETVESHDLILTTSLLSEASRRLKYLVKPSSSWQRDQTLLPPHEFQCENGIRSRPSPTGNSIKRKRTDEDDCEVYGTKKRRLSPPLPSSRKRTKSQQDVCEENCTRRRTSSATPAGRKRKRSDQNETEDSDEETKRRRT